MSYREAAQWLRQAVECAGATALLLTQADKHIREGRVGQQLPLVLLADLDEIAGDQDALQQRIHVLIVELLDVIDLEQGGRT